MIHDLISATATGFGDPPSVALPDGELTTLTILFGVFALCALAFCVTMAVRLKKAWPIFLFVGGGAACWYETLTDLLGRCVWAAPGDWPSLVNLFGFEMPLFYNFLYFFYFPIVQVSLIVALQRGMSFRTWIKLDLALAAGAAVFELYPVSQKWWWYYGEGHPLTVLDYPLYWAACADAAVMGGAAVIYMLRRNGFLPERYSFLMMALPACLTPMIHMAVVWPVHVAVSNSTNALLNTGPALVTVALAFTMSLLIGKVATEQSMSDKAARAAGQKHLPADDAVMAAGRA